MGPAIRARYCAVAVLLCAAAVLSLSHASAGPELPRYASLTILHTNDIHGHLFPFDYSALGSVETGVGGAARRAAMIRQMKGAAESPVLVMDAGDVFTRGPLADLKGVPDFAVMNAVPYDVMTLGNNEFKGASGLEGQRIMLDRIKQARFAVVSANVVDQATGKTIVPPYKIFRLGALKVGVFGLTAQRVAGYEQAKGLEIRDPLTTAKKITAELEGKANLIVALTHIGYPKDLELAATVPGIDVIIGGDSHTWLFEPTLVNDDKSSLPTWGVGGTIVCQAGEWGKCVGKLELSLRLADGDRYRAMGYKGSLVDVNAAVKPAQDVEHILYRAAKPFLREVGKLDADVPSDRIAAWVAERMREAAGTEVGVAPKDGIENGLKAGVVTYLDIRKMFPFLNEVVKLDVTGAQLKNFLASTESGVAGAEMRGGALHVGGKAVEDAGKYTLAIERFYASTSPALAGAEPAGLSVTTKDLVIRYLAGKPGTD